MAVRGSPSGWVLIDFYTEPGRVINSALADANTSGLGDVTLCGAAYPLQISVSFPASSLQLFGMGRATLINGNALATNNHAIILGGYSDCSVKELAVQTLAGGGKVCHCISISQGSLRATIESVVIVQSDTDGIHADGSLLPTIDDLNILHCHILSSDRYGIYMTETSAFLIESNHIAHTSDGVYIIAANYSTTFGIIVDNTSSQNTNNGISVGAIIEVTIDGNECFNNQANGIYAHSMAATITSNTASGNSADGIHVQTMDYVIVDDNTCHYNHTYGIEVDGTAFGTPVNRVYGISGNEVAFNDQHGIVINAVGVVVDSNILWKNNIDGPTYSGIYLMADADYCVISNNTIQDNIYGKEITSTYHGICLASGASDCIIEGNFCRNLNGSGIALLGDNNDCSITDNTCNDNVRYGIEIVAATADRNRVFGNTLRNNILGFILDNGTDTRFPEVTVYVMDPNGVIGTHPAVVLTDGVEVVARFEFKIPDEFQALVRARVILVPGGTGNLRRSASTDWGKICSGENYNTNTDSIAAGEVAVTINRLECIDVSAALTGIDFKDLVGFAFTRHGDHANDTVNADCYLLALNLQYV